MTTSADKNFMIRIAPSTVFLSFVCLAVVMFLLPQGIVGQQVGDCVDANLAESCEAENRFCVIELNGTEACGPCADGFVEFPVKQADSDQRVPTCINIDTDLTLQDFMEYFQPIFRPAGDRVDREAVGQRRLQALIEAARAIQEHNAMARNGTYSFELGLNKYATDDEEETEQLLGLLPIPENYTMKDPLVEAGVLTDDVDRFIAPVSTPPRYVNWVESRAVTSVKDQGRCGCCWSVAAAGAIEGLAAIQSNFTYLQSVSFQQMISCADQQFLVFQNQGCNGGYPAMAMAYADLNQFGGLATLNTYEFTDGESGDTTEECQTQNQEAAVETSGVRILMDGSPSTTFDQRVELMKKAVSQQPVSIVMVAGCKTLSRYKSGVLNEGCTCNPPGDCGINHAILLVGYNDDHDPPYWIISKSGQLPLSSLSRYS